MNRDKVVEQALTHELRANPGPMTPDCLDAETLAAFQDGGLNAQQMEAAELHLSTCARCQSMAAVMARGDATAAVAEQPQRFHLWSWWLAPIAAATAALVVWMVVPAQQQPGTAPPAPNVDAPVAREAQPQATPEANQAFAAKDRDQAAVAARRKEETPKLAEQKVAPSASADAIAAAPPAAPAPAPPAAGAAPTLMMQKSARAASTPEIIVSPNTTRRWRIIPGGIEYSTDEGTSWMPVRAVPTEALTHGVSPSGTICWFIGKDGLVLVTADGSIFARVDLPVKADVASITATDARSATVVTVDGRTFHTDDSGRNWRQN